MLVDFHTHHPTAWDEDIFTPSSFGIHPWHAADCRYESFDHFCSCHLEAMQQADAVGECGLDRTCNVDFDLQRALFQYHLMLADGPLGGKPVVVHCVRAYDELLALRKHYRRAPWVVHGFRGGMEQALQLHRAAIGISFGAAIINVRNDKLRRCLYDYPYPFMLETDADTTPIADIYAEAAHIKGVSVEALIQQVGDYCISLFKNLKHLQ